MQAVSKGYSANLKGKPWTRSLRRLESKVSLRLAALSGQRRESRSIHYTRERVNFAPSSPRRPCANEGMKLWSGPVLGGPPWPVIGRLHVEKWWLGCYLSARDVIFENWRGFWWKLNDRGFCMIRKFHCLGFNFHKDGGMNFSRFFWRLNKEHNKMMNIWTSRNDLEFFEWTTIVNRLQFFSSERDIIIWVLSSLQ